ncbi:GTP cyclohydrolase II [Pseudovibrio exalbescens]|uniref:GTP cyclohydrolase II n=1 Tax=Pseudovibrio exalbescens TaxID=197461 RepID=UPI0023661D37|nr:GTP cyclohydrolase II [Pseudovibrio exalbescens]MDD7910064.1 GTP cyclohydrolase II [Pseudovibrio exalbescens]
MESGVKRPTHIRLSTHPGAQDPSPYKLKWGEVDPQQRGPVIASPNQPENRNTIGVHGGSYSLYKALAVSSGSLDPDRRPDYNNTHPMVEIGPYPQWSEPGKIVSLDPFGAMTADLFGDLIAKGVDIRPTIAITKAKLDMPELKTAIAAGALKVDGAIVNARGEVSVTKAAIDPVWHLPGIAARFGVEEDVLRRTLFEQTGGMYPDLITRSDLEVFLPPIGGTTLYVIGDVEGLTATDGSVTCRVHDECNGSDVFGSDICTCRPYLLHGLVESIQTAQAGGTGLIIYNRKEGRALGEVTKFLVYNARKRQEGGDSAATYFARTECVAGVQDARFQELMPDVLHWLGITRIGRFISMSDMKYNALIESGISIDERVALPDELIPADAQVEMEAKKAAGYFSNAPAPSGDELKQIHGRSIDDY